MNNKLKIDFDQAYIDEVERIRPRLGMYIGSHKLKDLDLYMIGYMSALNNFAENRPDQFTLRWFTRWLIERYGYYGGSTNHTFILEEEIGKTNHDEMLDLYYRLLNKYKIKTWGKLLAKVTLNESNIPIQDWKGTNPRWEDGKLKLDVYPTPKRIELTFSDECFSTGYYTYDEKGIKTFESFRKTYDEAFKSLNKLFQIQPDQWKITHESLPMWSETKILEMLKSEGLHTRSQAIIALVNNSQDDQLVENMLLSIIKSNANGELRRITLYGLMRRIMYKRKWVDPLNAVSVLSQISNDVPKAILRLRENLLDDIEKQLNKS